MRVGALLSIIICLVSFLTCQRNIQGTEDAAFSWKMASPQSQGIDGDKLEIAFDKAGGKGFIHGLVVVRDGFLVGERYYNGFDQDDAHNVQSVSKSFLSALYGIAVEQNKISIDDKIMDYLSPFESSVHDQRIYDITVNQLLTMRSGFPGDQQALLPVMYSSDWIRSTLNQTLQFNPGSSFKYSTIGTHLLSVILTKACGHTSLAFAEKYLTGPLGISIREWQHDPLGFHIGGTNMHFTPRDLARFGQLYLNNGQIDARQIVPSDWVAKSFTPSYVYKNGTWGDIENIAYGVLWWLGEMRGNRLYMALGYAGQFIVIFPDLDLIITACSNSNFADWDKGDEQERQVLSVMAEYILPSMIE